MPTNDGGGEGEEEEKKGRKQKSEKKRIKADGKKKHLSGELNCWNVNTSSWVGAGVRAGTILGKDGPAFWGYRSLGKSLTRAFCNLWTTQHTPRITNIIVEYPEHVYPLCTLEALAKSSMALRELIGISRLEKRF